MFSFPRAVWLLGFVSLATDAATEAIYPILPFFLTTVLGASAVSLGIVEGAAEAVNSALKILSGRMADRARSKRPLVVIGYSISSFVRPMMALAQSWSHVFLIRVCDRVGKGIRGAPRDAMLAGFATQENRGQIYSFHRGMDHSGAIVGPILATVVLYFYPGEYRTLFALTIVPGAIAVLLIFFVSEDTVDRPDRAGGAGPEPARAEAARANTISEPLPRSFKHFMLVLMLFMLGSSTDAFLLLKLTDATGGTRWVPLMWAGLHVVKASVSILFGSWSDRAGRRTVIAAGWSCSRWSTPVLPRSPRCRGSSPVSSCTDSISGLQKVPRKRSSRISRRHRAVAPHSDGTPRCKASARLWLACCSAFCGPDSAPRSPSPPVRHLQLLRRCFCSP
jgi:MFS family permease